MNQHDEVTNTKKNQRPPMNVHGPALKLHTNLTQRMILSDSAFHAHRAFKYSLSTEDSNAQCRIGGQGGCALSSSLFYLCGRSITSLHIRLNDFR